MEKIYTYIIAKYTNYQGNHQVISVKYPMRQKIKKEIKRVKNSKMKKIIDKVIESQAKLKRLNGNLKEVNLDLDIKNNNWIGSFPALPFSFIQDPKSLNTLNFWKC